jgi:hypothetical protein
MRMRTMIAVWNGGASRKVVRRSRRENVAGEEAAVMVTLADRKE